MVNRLDYKILGAVILVLVCWVGHSLVECRSAVVWSDDNPVRTDISVHVANDMINNNTGYPNLLILDVRDQWEYDTIHLHDALLIPLSELASRLDEIESYNETEVIVYCRTGVRSQQGSDILVAHNFTKVFNMLGGITAWIDAGYDYWSNEDVPTTTTTTTTTTATTTTTTTTTATSPTIPMELLVVASVGAAVIVLAIVCLRRK